MENVFSFRTMKPYSFYNEKAWMSPAGPRFALMIFQYLKIQSFTNQNCPFSLTTNLFGPVALIDWPMSQPFYGMDNIGLVLDSELMLRLWIKLDMKSCYFLLTLNAFFHFSLPCIKVRLWNALSQPDFGNTVILDFLGCSNACLLRVWKWCTMWQIGFF